MTTRFDEIGPMPPISSLTNPAQGDRPDQQPPRAGEDEHWRDGEKAELAAMALLCSGWVCSGLF